MIGVLCQLSYTAAVSEDGTGHKSLLPQDFTVGCNLYLELIYFMMLWYILPFLAFIHILVLTYRSQPLTLLVTILLRYPFTLLATVMCVGVHFPGV